MILSFSIAYFLMDGCENSMKYMYTKKATSMCTQHTKKCVLQRQLYIRAKSTNNIAVFKRNFFSENPQKHSEKLLFSIVKLV